MRTTIDLDEHLLARLKALAAQTQRTLNAVVEDALREALARREEVEPQTRSAVPRFDGGTLRPGVDLGDSSGLLDLMELDDGDA